MHGIVIVVLTINSKRGHDAALPVFRSHPSMSVGKNDTDHKHLVVMPVLCSVVFRGAGLPLVHIPPFWFSIGAHSLIFGTNDPVITLFSFWFQIGAHL